MLSGVLQYSRKQNSVIKGWFLLSDAPGFRRGNYREMWRRCDHKISIVGKFCFSKAVKILSIFFANPDAARLPAVAARFIQKTARARSREIEGLPSAYMTARLSWGGP